MQQIIQGLWIGEELSVMERLSIASFLANGHEYHLYAYGNVANVPAGTIVKDGEEILPSSMIFQYSSHASYSGFANFFRYKLLLDKGGWWVDTDAVCLKPFEFMNEHVFSSERDNGKEVVTSGFIRAPAGSPMIRAAWKACQESDPASLNWGQLGPRLVGQLVHDFDLSHLVQPSPVFCPFSFDTWNQVLDSDCDWQPDNSTVAIHLWNEMWRRAGCDKNGRFEPQCLYERLKTRYL